MRAPLTPAAPAQVADLPEPTMLIMAAAIMDSHGKFDSASQALEESKGKVPHSDYDENTTLIAPANPSPKAKQFLEDAKRTHEDLNKLRVPERRKELRIR